MRVTLLQIGGSETKEYPIDVDEFVIGRDHACNLRLDHGRISRNHCRVHRVNDKVLVEALYSAAGTAVNQKVIDPNRPPVEVHDGDHLWVGSEHFQFLIESNVPDPGRKSVGLGSSADLEPMANPLLRFESPPNPLAAKGTAATPYRVTTPQPPAARPTPATAKARGPEPLPLDEGEGAEDQPEPLGTVVVTERDGIATVRLLQKAIVSDSDIRAITGELAELIDSGRNRITLHFGSVERLTSEVLGEVYQVYRRCKAEGGMLKICKVAPQVAGVFALTNMQKHIEIFPDELSALKSPWPQAAPAAAAPPPPAPRKVAPAPAPAPVITRHVQLIVEVGRAKGRAIEINAPKFLIGRGEQCQLRPNSNEISRLHTAIEQRDGRVFVCDLGSKGGTVLNGRVLHSEEAEASHGDRLQIEALQFTFAVEARVSSAPPPPHTPAEAIGALFGEASTDSNAATSLMTIPTFDAASAAAAAAPPRAAAPSPLPAHKSRRRANLAVEVVGEVNLVTLLTADLSAEATISAVRAELEAIPLLAARERRVIRFDHVETFGRGAVVMLLARAQQLARTGGTLRFCNISPSIMSYIETTQLPMMIEIFPTLSEAMSAPWDAVEANTESARSGTH